MKRKRHKKKTLSVFIIIFASIIILFAFLIIFNILINNDSKINNQELEGELSTLRPSGEESIEEILLIESSISSTDSPIEENEGYIIELESEPFFKNRAGGIAYKNQVREEHIVLKQQIEKNLGKTIGADIELLGEFEDAFNGLALGISKQECEFLKTRIDLIKDCYPNLKVHTLLDESVKVIKGDIAYSEFGLTGENVTIAVIDTGIDPNHESLDDLDDNLETNDPKIVGFKDFVNFRQAPYDDHFHGTHVAGIAAGTGGSKGIYKGVAPQAKLVGVKVLNSWGSGSFSDVIAGIEWTIQNKDRYNISIISMSLGANINSDGTTPVEIAATTAVENGINFVVAAGNRGPSGNTVGIPASAKKVITVGAIDDNKEIASFSSRGPTKDGRIKPEVSAPGVDIMAPDLGTKNKYRSLSGTSMATPHVAGVVALLKEANSSLNSDEIRELLMNSSLDKGEKGPDNIYGWGVVDALQALLKVYPQGHELTVNNIESKNIYDTNTPINIKAIIKNNGLNDETNVKVRFLVDGIEQSTRIIDSIEAGSEVSLDFIYVSTQEKTFEITISIDSVNGENVVFDNSLKKEAIIKDYKGKIKAVVLDSWGASGYSQYTIFPDLNENWFNYGDYKVEIDYESFKNKETTYDLLKQSDADVLIISDSWQDGGYIPGSNWEFSDSEIQAIKQYVEEGHGLIITSGTLSTNSPGNVENNMKLAPLVGIDENSSGYWSKSLQDYNFKINYLNHDLFNNLDEYYYNYITNTNLNLSREDAGDIVAISGDNLSIITGHHYGLGNTIYFANLPEYSRVNNQQIFYNSILWTNNKYEQKNHDLKLFDLNLDSLIKYGENKIISAKLVNKGNVSENNIIARLLIDDIQVDSLNILLLDIGEEVNVSFNFSLNETGNKKIIIKVDEISEETNTYDNTIGKKVFVPSSSLTDKFYDYGIDGDGDGLYEYLAVDVELDVIESDYFNLQGLLTSQLGVEFETSSNGESLSPGLHNLTLKFSGLELRRMELNGPYKLKELILSEKDEEINLDIIHNTKAYSHNQFESYPDLSVSDLITEKDDDVKIIVNKSTSIQVDIQNTGTEEAFNVNVSLYRENDEGNGNKLGKDNEFILIESFIIDNIPVFEEKSFIFNITPEKFGYINYIINISNDKDENSENNEYWFSLEVLPEDADVTGNFYYVSEKAIKAIINKELSLTAFIENRGIKEAENVSVQFYEEECKNECNYKFIESQNIGNLSVDETKEITFIITPKKLGTLVILGNISSSNEENKENNEFQTYIEISAEGVDMMGDFYPITYPFIINEQGKIGISLENTGTEEAFNINAILYEDTGTLKNIWSINLNNLEVDEFYYEEISFLPVTAGYNEFILKITADNDVNLNNNEIRRSIDVKLKSPDLIGFPNYDYNKKLIFNQENNISYTIYNEGVENAQNVIVSLYYLNYSSGEWRLIDSKNIGNLPFDDEREISFLYIPAELGWNDFKINFSADNEAEEYLDNNENRFNLRVVSRADLRAYVDSYNKVLLINQNNNITSYIYNEGVENAQNVIASLYYYNYSVENWKLIEVKNIGLVEIDEEKEINFSFYPTESGYSSFKINLTADNEGNYEDNEDGFSFYVADNGPNIEVELQSWKVNDAIIDNEVFIPAEISNVGNVDAIASTCYNADVNDNGVVDQSDYDLCTQGFGRTGCVESNEWCNRADINRDSRVDGADCILVTKLKNCVVSGDIQLILYKVFYDDNGLQTLTEISRKTISKLSASEKTIVEFDYLPKETGFIELKLVSLYPGDVYSGNDYDYGELEILNSLTDVSGSFLFYDSYAINNEVNYIDIEVRDNDIIGAKNVLVELYDNGTLINNFFIPKLNASDSVFFKDISWIPTFTGKHNLTLIVRTEDDIIYTEFIEVYNKGNITFNLKDPNGISASRYLTINDNRYLVENSPYNINVIDIPQVDIGVDNINYNENSSKEVLTVFLDSRLNNPMDLTTKYHENINDKGLGFYIVYANNPNWTYNNLSYHILYSSSEQNLNNFSIYGCLNWDFSNLSCKENWIKNNEIVRYVGEEGVYVSGNFNDKITAIGFGAGDQNYNNTEWCNRADINRDSRVDGADCIIITKYKNCIANEGNNWCSNADINHDGIVNDTDDNLCTQGFGRTGCGVSQTSNIIAPGGGNNNLGDSSGGTTSGSSGGGVSIETRFFSNKNSNESLKINLDKEGLDVEFLGLTFVNKQSNGFISFKKINSLDNIPELEYITYSYFSIENNIEDGNIKNGNIVFKVDKQWLEDNKVDNKDIVLLRYHDSWRTLPTNYQSSDTFYNYYNSDINGFSIFAISAKPSEENEGKIEFKIKNYIFYMIILAIIFASIIILSIKLINLRKERENQIKH